MKKLITISVMFSTVVIMLTAQITFGESEFPEDPFTTITTIPGELNLSVRDGTVTGSRDVIIKVFRSQVGFGCEHIHEIRVVGGKSPNLRVMEAEPNLCGFALEFNDTIPDNEIVPKCLGGRHGETVSREAKWEVKLYNNDFHSYDTWVHDITMPVHITCECNSLQFSGIDMEKATVGQYYVDSFGLKITSGEYPYRFSHTGILPPGLTLSENGHISGTPQDYGEYHFQVRVDDSCPFGTQTASESFELYVCKEEMDITSPPVLPGGIIYESYEHHHQFSGSEPITYSLLGDLPPGLTLSPSGVISGVPTSPGEYEFTVKGVDHCNKEREHYVSLAILTKPEITLEQDQSMSAKLGQAGEEPKSVASLKRKSSDDEGKPVAKSPIPQKKTTIDFVGVKDSRGMRTPLRDKISIEQGKKAILDINGKEVDLMKISVPRGVKIEKDNTSSIKRELILKGSKAGKYQVRLHDRDNKVLKVVTVEVTAPEKVYTTLKKPVTPATSPDTAGKKLAVKSIPPAKQPLAKAGSQLPAKTAPMQSPTALAKPSAKPSAKTPAIQPAPKSPVPSKTAPQAKKAPVKKPAPKATPSPAKGPAPPTETAMKKPGKTMPKTTQMAVKKAPAQPKAGKAPTAPAPRPAKTAPPAPSGAKKSTVTAKKTVGKTEQAGIIFVSKDPRMKKTHRMHVGGQQVTIVITGENLNKIKSAQVLDKNNRPVSSNIVKVVRLQSDKPTELKVTLMAVAMPKAGSTCKLRLKAGNKSVETPVRLEVMAAKKKKMDVKPIAPIQKKR
jgi:hypothetical protein